MTWSCRWMVAGLLAGCLLVAGCEKTGDAGEEEVESHAAEVEHLEGAEPARVTLTEDAAQRLQIHTALVQEREAGQKPCKVIPYAAILYDNEGATWTYTNPEPLVFFRHGVIVDHVAGDLAFLSDGPPVGTAVVTMGVAELYGSEVEFEEE